MREVEGPRHAPTVLLLHGLGATGGLNWFPAFGPLARHYHVAAMDHRGHGRGLRTRRPFRLEDCADDVAALVGVLGRGPVILAGYSMGGPIAQLTWHRHPDVVAGLVLCATSYRFGPRDRRLAPMGDAAGLALRFTPRLMRQQMLRGALGVNGRLRARPAWVGDELRAHDPAAVVEAAVAIRRFDATAWLGELDRPAASVITQYDRLVPPRHQCKLAELTRATVHTVAGGHDACVTKPHLFVPSLLDACASVARRVEGQTPTAPRERAPRR